MKYKIFEIGVNVATSDDWYNKHSKNGDFVITEKEIVSYIRRLWNYKKVYNIENIGHFLEDWCGIKSLSDEAKKDIAKISKNLSLLKYLRSYSMFFTNDEDFYMKLIENISNCDLIELYNYFNEISDYFIFSFREENLEKLFSKALSIDKPPFLRDGLKLSNEIKSKLVRKYGVDIILVKNFNPTDKMVLNVFEKNKKKFIGHLLEKTGGWKYWNERDIAEFLESLGEPCRTKIEEYIIENSLKLLLYVRPTTIIKYFSNEELDDEKFLAKFKRFKQIVNNYPSLALAIMANLSSSLRLLFEVKLMEEPIEQDSTKRIEFMKSLHMLNGII